jgi:hypothetical protein
MLPFASLLTRIVSMLTELGQRDHKVGEDSGSYGSFDNDNDNDNENENENGEIWVAWK